MKSSTLLSLVILSILLMSALVVYDKHQSYWLGIHWERTLINETTPAFKITQSDIPALKKGDVLTHIWMDNSWHRLDSVFLLSLLDASESTANLEKTIAIDDWLYKHRSQPHQFKLANQNIVELTPKAMRWQDLTDVFWGHRVFFYVSALLALACIYLSKKVNKTLRINAQQSFLVLAFISMGMCVVTGPVSLDRLWGTEKDELLSRYYVSVCVTATYVWSLLWLLFSNPINLGKKHKAYWLIWWLFSGYYAITVVLLFLKHAQAMSFLHSAYVFLPIFILALLVNQWWFSLQKGAPLVDKVAVKSVFMLNLLLALIYGGVNALVHAQFLEQANPNLLNSIASLIVLSSVVFLVFRKHLYRITYWWWVLYPMTAGSIAFLLAFFFSSNFGRQYNTANMILSGSLALFTIAVTAFWHIYKLMRSNIEIMRKASFSAQALTGLEPDSDAFWKAQIHLFTQAFQSSNVERVSAIAEPVKLENNGEALRIKILPKTALLLSPPEKGRRLFNEQDVQTAILLHDLATQQQREQQAFIAGEKQTRQQVAHDLHDDIGGRLHQLAHGDTKNAADYAQKTLEQLRTLTHALHKGKQPLSSFLAGLRHELLRHAQSCSVDIKLHINITEDCQEQPVSAMAMVQLNSIMNELCRNALQHKGVGNITAHLDINEETTDLEISNDGEHTRVKDWIAGVGTVSIKRRIHQLDGSIEWLENPDGGVNVQAKFNTQTWLEL